MYRAAMLAALGVTVGVASGLVSAPAAATTPYDDIDAGVDGSVQNPAWSPDGNELLVTVWRGGYNVGPADLMVIPLDGGETRTLVADGWDNVNLPGSSWSPVTGEITYSSTEDPHDEIWVIAGDGSGGPRRVTLHDAEVAYEPAWNPDADEVVYEVHPLDVEGEGRIARSPVGPDEVDNVAQEVFLTPESEDCRQPNWAPVGDLVVFQCTEDGGESWTLYVADPDGDDRRPLATASLNATDASFSPDGTWVVFSGDDGESSADLWAIEVDGTELVQLTDQPGYEGAPSWSPDGQRVAFERSDGDPDGSATTIAVVDVTATSFGRAACGACR
jgi:TolB protein